ncbi:MAG TPA: TIGR02450 family Trp-rich protein [Azonexus sp.]|nr:TIGR02450 family Trp-rich protein [Azonexus sp.]
MNWHTGRQLNPRKLIMSKWTAAVPSQREKHFIVTMLLEPVPPASQAGLVEIEAIYTGRRFTLPWRELLEGERWLQGWQ